MATYQTVVDPNGGGDYTSISAWQAGEKALYSSGDIAIAYCRRTGSTKDTTTVSITGWTAGVIPKIIVDPDYRHEGIFQDTNSLGNYVYTLTSTTDWVTGINAATNATYVEGMQIQMTATNTTAFSASVSSATFESCIGVAGTTGFNMGGYGQGGHQFSNCFALDCKTGFSDGRGDNNSGRYCRVENCTTYNCSLYGVWAGYGTIINNTYAGASGTADFGSSNSFAPGGDNTATSDTTSIGTTQADSLSTYASYFVDIANGDPHLIGASTSVFGIGGSDLSARFTTDIDGTTRSTWDIGCDEYVSAATNVTVNAGVQTVTSSEPTLTIIAIKNKTVSPNTQVITASQQSIGITVGDGATPSVQTVTFTQNNPSITTIRNVTVSLGIQTTTSDYPLPTISFGAEAVDKTVLPITQTLTASQNSISITVGDGATPSVQTATFTQISPSVTVTSSVTVSPNVQTSTFSQVNPVITAVKNVTVSVGVQSLTASQISPSVSVGEGIAPDVQTGSFTQISPVVTAVKNVSVSPDVQTLTSSLQSITITVGDSVTNAVQTAVFNQISPSITAIKNVTVSPNVQTLTATAISPTIDAQQTQGRLWSSGFELNSLTAGVEITSTLGTPDIVTSPVRSGAYALHTAAGEIVRYTFSASDTSNTIFYRFYFRKASNPSSPISVAFGWANTYNSEDWYLELNADGTLTLRDQLDSSIGTSSALNNNQWYRVEIKCGDTENVLQARLEGVQFASGTISEATGQSALYLDGNSAEAHNFYFDDIAINTNDWPGEGKIIHLRPNAAGDAADWGAYTNVDEITPDDNTTKDSSSTLNQESLYNLTDSGIGSADTVSLIHVGARYNGVGASANSGFKLEVEKASAGTISQSSEIIPANTTWVTNANSAPRNYPITLYQDPDSSAWTQTTLDSAQIGYKTTTADTNAAQISTVWMLAEYVSGSVIVTPSVQSATLSQISPTITTTKSVVVSPSVQVLTASQQNPAITTTKSIVVSPDSQTLAFSQQSITITVGDGVTPAPQTAIFSQANPSISYDFITSVGVQTATVSVQSPTVSVGEGLILDIQTAVFTVLSPTVSTAGNIIVSPNTQVATFTNISPSVSVGEGLTPNVQVATFSLNNPTVIAIKNVTTSTNAQTVTFSAVNPSISVGEGLEMGVQTGTFSQMNPSVTAIQNVTASPSVQTLTFSQISPSVTAGGDITVNTGVQTLTFSAISPTVTTVRSVTTTPTAQSAVFSTQTPSVIAGGDIYLSLNEQTAVFTLNNPTITTETSITVSLDVQSAVFTPISPSISVGEGVSPDVQTATFSLQNPTINISEGLALDIQTATFTALSPTVSIGEVQALGVQTATFSAISPSITVQEGVSLGVQTATFTAVSPTVTAVKNVTFSPNVQTAIFTNPDASPTKDVTVYPPCLVIGPPVLAYNEQLRPIYRIARDIYLTL